ncbi:MAG: class I SAM-dependent methyltransferase [Candidatus Methylacidiphilales bacterium]
METSARSASEQLQLDQYNRISDGYEKHYGDEWSRAYRREFLFAPMTRGVQLRNVDVLEAMCGSGESTPLLLEAGARVTALDISDLEIAKFKSRHPEATALLGSIRSTGLPDHSREAVCVFGGLHHLHPHLMESVEEIHRILKPGGWLLFTEPHAGSLPEIMRQIWYRVDHLFAENERGIPLQEMKAAFGDRFEFEIEHYGGSFGYLLVLNSMVFRLPWAWKRHYAPWCFRLERLLDSMLKPIQGRLPARLVSCSVSCRWRKKG